MEVKMQKAKLIYDIKFDEWVMSYPKRWHETRSLFYDALELENKEEKKAILIYKQLLNELHNCDLDSYTHYGTFLKQKKRIYEGKSLISRAYVLALNAIPADYYDKPGKIIWAHIDNRPLLRTFHFAGLDFEEDGFYKQAERLYKFIAVLNKLEIAFLDR